MKKLLLSMCISLCVSHIGYSQCSTTASQNNNQSCNYGGNSINGFTMAGVASDNPGCSGYPSYTVYTTPVRTLYAGVSYPWAIITGGNYSQLGVGIWIDLNNDNVYQSTEMIASDGTNSYHSGYFTLPLTVTPGTNRAMRVRACGYNAPSGSQACNYISYYGEIEDYKVDIIIPPNCSGTTPGNTVITPTYQICNGSPASLSLLTPLSYTNVGYSYQWQYSNATAVGPWTVIPTATANTYAVPSVTASSYYSVLISCAFSSGTITTTAGQVTVAPTTTNTVPYYEGFEGINFDNQLPNCSWMATNSPGITQTYISTRSQGRSAHTGSKYAAFYAYYQTGTNYFYSSGLQMSPGITYSANIWYKTEIYGYGNVTNLSLMMGSSQSTTGLVNIATNAPASAGLYSPLGGTFTVPSAGIYYMAIKATSNGSYGTYYLKWDDLSVEIPCSLNPVTVNLSTTPQATICSGETINLTASGADTFTWNTGSNASALNEMPNGNFLYSVVGTNTLTGCTSTVTQMVNVLESPEVVVFSDKAISCSGTPVHLSAYGADSYAWSTTSALANITVSPSLTTLYTVVGTSTNNCSTTVVQQVSVVANPTVTATSSAPNVMCSGETQMLTGNGNGVVNFEWSSSSLFIQSQTALISPMTTTSYTLSGTDGNGCVGKTTIIQSVDACTGIAKLTTLSGVKIYPNPSAGLFTVELNSTSNKTVEVTDITGRVVFSTVAKDERISVNISTLSSGIYYVKVQSENATDVIKVVKQ